MDSDYFESLTPEEAQEFLDHYLEIEKAATCAQLPSMAADGVLADFSVASVPNVMKWMLPKLQIRYTEWDESVPKWLRDCEEHKRGSVSFEEESKNLVLQASYYLGESFVRQYKNVSWGLGKPNIAFHNMPVVCGFCHNLELPTIAVAENLFLRILQLGAPAEAIDTAIRYWRENAP